MNTPLVIAHRGDTKHAPENTLAAFELAIAKGVDVIEFDVHATKDGALVVHHDYYLERTTDGKGYIGDHTLAEIQRLDAGSGFGPAFKGERLPTLDDVLRLGKGKVRFEIELKTTSLGFVERVVEALHDHDVVDAVELTSSHIPLLHRVAIMNTGLRLGMFFNAPPSWMQTSLGQRLVMDYLLLSRVQVAHLPGALLQKQFVTDLHSEGFLLHGANLNQREEIQNGIDCCIDQFSTDDVDVALACVQHGADQ